MIPCASYILFRICIIIQYTVDARDVAKAEEILLAESKMVQSGERFFLFSGDILYPKHFGPEIMRLFPNEQYD